MKTQRYKLMTVTTDNNANLSNTSFRLQLYTFYDVHTPQKSRAPGLKWCRLPLKTHYRIKKNPIHPQNFLRVLLLYFFESFMAPVCRGYSPLYPATIPSPTKCNPLQ